MAFGQGKVSTDGGSFKRYVGVGTVKVLAINPTMAEWNEITGGNLQKEPEYVSTNGEGVKIAKITLLVQPDPKKTIGEIDTVIPVSFWFRKLPVQGNKTGKYQVIDKYGRTAWATKEEIEAKKIPQYTNGPANIDADYRRIVIGEESFTNFLKAYLGIPSLTYRDKAGNIITREHPDECEARLDGIMKVFEGDFEEIKTIMGYQPNNYVKMLFGVKTTEEGREYQDVFMDCFLTSSNHNHVLFAKSLAEVMRGGRHIYDNTYFGECNANGELILQDLRERVITPTTFEENNVPAPEVSEAQMPSSAANDDLPF